MEHSQEIAPQALDRFLKRGTVTVPALQLAAEIDRRIIVMVQSSLPKAMQFSRRLVKCAKKSERSIQLASYRALARAALMSSGYAESRDAYLVARRLLGNDRVGIGRIDRTLIDVYMYLDNFAESKRRAQMALRTFTKLGDQAEIAKVRVNYANLLHRQDRHREAEKLYRLAGDYFESRNDLISAARCWFNRANTLVQLFDFESAEQLFRRSEEIYRGSGNELDAVDALWGRSWLHMLQGKYHVALRELETCEADFRRIGRDLRVASCVLDRAEVFLNLNLFDDAYECAKEASARFSKMAVGYEQAKATYYRALAASGMGKAVEARSLLKKSTRTFHKEKNLGFLGATSLLTAMLSGTPGERRRALLKAIRLFSRAQLPLWSASVDIHATFEGSLCSGALDRLSRNKAAKGVPHLYAAWQTRLGDANATAGRMNEASRHWEAAANCLDRIKAQLPPLGIRSRSGKAEHSPHAKLVSSRMKSDPRVAAIWSERYKTAGVWRPEQAVVASSQGRQRIEKSLGALAGHVAALSNQFGWDGERSLSATKSSRHLQRLEREVRRELLLLEDNSTLGQTDNNWLVRQFDTTSRKLPIVQFHATDHELFAFVHENGRVRVIEYPDGASLAGTLIAKWNFLLESAALSAHLPGGNDLQSERAFLTELGECLWRPLGVNRKTDRILILAEGAVSNLPWHAIQIDEQALVDRHELLHAPSLRHYLQACQRPVAGGESKIFLGSTEDLPAATHELESVLKIFGSGAGVHQPCSRSDWPESGKFRWWHYLGHAQLNERNPFYSSLILADGPLFAADFRLKRANVDLVTLAACQTGAQVFAPGEESTGLVRSLLEMGARTVVAGQWPVADESTALWMSVFYGRLKVDSNPMSAARVAAKEVRRKFPSAHHWAAFSVFGAGV